MMKPVTGPGLEAREGVGCELAGGQWQDGGCVRLSRMLWAAVICIALMCVALCAARAAVDSAFADERGDEAASASAETLSPSKESMEDEGEPEEASGTDGDNVIDPTQRADNSFIYDTTIDTLFDQATLYEGRTVQVVGEVIGDLIKEGSSVAGRDLYWITVTSIDAENKATISVLITAEQAKQIDHYGRYGVTGTVLQVRGTFHQACSDHEGLPDIHAANTEAITHGVEHGDVLVLQEFVPGVIAVLLGAILMGVYYIVRERSR